MPPARWVCPEDERKHFKEHPSDTNYIECKLCQSYGMARAAYISRGSWKSHINCSTHQSCVANFKEQETKAALLTAEVNAAYDTPGLNYPARLDKFPAHYIAPPMIPPTVHEPAHYDQEDLCATAAWFSQRDAERSPPTTPEAIKIHLKEEFERILAKALESDALGDEDASDDDDLEQEDEDNDAEIRTMDQDTRFFPYPNETVFLLDVADNLPRCRFTGAQMSVILHLLKRLGARNVPSFKSLRKSQKSVHDTFGNNPTKVTSAFGNVFYVNNICQSIARDFANPLVAPHLNLYPEEVGNGPISERWQAERAFDYEPEQLTPMFTNGVRRWWINELSQLKDGRFVIPQTWILRSGKLTSDAYSVSRTAANTWECDGREIQIAAEDLAADFDDIAGKYGPNFTWTERSQPFVCAMPNKIRALSGDRDLYVVGISIWIDDVSGNKSKQYYKFIVMLGQNTAIPGKLLKQEFHVHYMAASPHATTAEFNVALRDFIRKTETEPIICYNAHTGREASFILRVVDKNADNPQQSEEASHIGCNGNCPCRKCKWGGPKKAKETAKVYHECHDPGIARTAEEIRLELEKQLEMATKGASFSTLEKRQKETGIKDKLTQYWIEKVLVQIAALKVESPGRNPADITNEVQQWLAEQPGDKMNPLLDITGLDPARDTPVEILHTVLLGVVRYVWHHMHTKQWSDEDRQLLAIRLQSTDISGLNVPPVRGAYMMQYRNNLIGKHYKTIMQALVFHVHNLCTPEQFQLIKATADLGARVWVATIDNLTEYISELKVAVANVLDAWDTVDPLRILVKIKLHLLAHLPEDIIRFGPAVRFSTETQESYNAVFRMCSINSNSQAPSRDIAAKFARMNSVKHILCGGFWESTASREHSLGIENPRDWLQPGSEVSNVLRTDPVFQRYLGWVTNSNPAAGSVRLLSRDKHPPVLWCDTMASTHWKRPGIAIAETGWRRAKYVIARSGDKVQDHAWVFAHDENGKTFMGRVAEIVSGDGPSVVTIERFMCTEARHPVFDWPTVRRPSGEEITSNNVTSYVAVRGSDVQFACSVQHDCRRGGCNPSVIGKQRQEREETTHDISLIRHNDDEHFVLNLGSTHNFVELTRTLPADAFKLKPLQSDRLAFHTEVAAKAHAKRSVARKQTAQKTAATKKRKAAEAAEAAAAAEVEAQRAQAVAAGAQETGDDDDDEQETDDSGNEADSYAGDSEREESGDDDDDYIPAKTGNKRGRGGGRKHGRRSKKRRVA